MKKPTYNWRKLILKMEPEKRYTHENFAKLIAATDPDGTSPTVPQIIAIYKACGHYVQIDHCGYYHLTPHGLSFRERNFQTNQ